MLPFNPGGHAAYRDHVLTNLRKYYPDPSSLPKSTLDILERFSCLDLSYTDVLMKERYSAYGPQPRLPSCMLRSVLLSLEFKITSVTEWAAALKSCPLYAAASGFDFGDTPGVGTFYDFFNRLWMSDEDNFSAHLHQPKKSKVQKPSKKGAKAVATEKSTVEQLLKRLLINPVSDEQPYSLLFSIYKGQFFDISVQKGLIKPENLALAGDGMPVYTSARERKGRVCNCLENGIKDCDCERYYSQPDCDIGWDSSRWCFYSGYNLYTLVASASDNDLPVFPLLHPASRHDSHSFLYSYFTMKAFFPELNVQKLILDSAHDAWPIYEYLRLKNITPFIDLTDKRGINLKYKDDFTIGSDGVPSCLKGLKMRHDGSDKRNHRIKFRCPLASRIYGCSCADPCSDSKFGRTVHLQTKDNPRLFNIPSRDSIEWKDEYKARTSVERSNKRIKVDFQIENGSHRSSKMWYCRLYCILMLQHLNAWGLPNNSPLRKIVVQAA